MTFQLDEQGECGDALKEVLAEFNTLLKEKLSPFGKYLFYLNFIALPNNESDSDINVVLYTRPDIAEDPTTEDYKTKILQYVQLLSVRLGSDPFVISSVLHGLIEENESKLDVHSKNLTTIEHDSSVSKLNYN